MNFTLPANPLLNAATNAAKSARKLVAGVDLAFAHDGCALVILERTASSVAVVDHDFRVPSPNAPLDPIAVAEHYMDRLEAMGCRVVTADIHYIEVLRRAALNRGISLLNAPSGQDRLKAFIALRHYTRARAIAFPAIVRDHLSKIRLVLSAGGAMSVHAPRSEGKGHADLAFALVAAVHADSRLHGALGDTSLEIRTHRGAWTSP